MTEKKEDNFYQFSTFTRCLAFVAGVTIPIILLEQAKYTNNNNISQLPDSIYQTTKIDSTKNYFK